MPVLPEKDTREEILAASLSHEMKTPLAAIQAASASLRKNLHDLARSMDQAGDAAPALREIMPLVSAALADPHSGSPETGLAVQKRIASVAARLARAGLAQGQELAASVIIRGGWERRLEALEPLLAKRGAHCLIEVLDAASKVRSNLRCIDAAAARLLNLVAGMRLGLGAPPPASEAFDLRSCLNETLETLQHAVPAGVEVDLRCVEGLMVRGSAGPIAQVVSNLVVNALAAAPAAGGRVLIEAELTSRGIALKVIDNGEGIPKAIEARLFTPFFTTKAAGGGTGLGLFISRRIVEGHGGTLTFESRPGRTCFEVRLPAAGPAEPGPARGGS